MALSFLFHKKKPAHDRVRHNGTTIAAAHHGRTTSTTTTSLSLRHAPPHIAALSSFQMLCEPATVVIAAPPPPTTGSVSRVAMPSAKQEPIVSLVRTTIAIIFSLTPSRTGDLYQCH
ncbi:hypothetical protein HanIR_Chr06g0269501 [Helianthus annuus]|nr:hypothetical protein HanIR_Chr06g0269501 [Helianthus annuus]